MIDAATTVELDLGDAGLESALGDELADLLSGLLVAGLGALELSLERGRGNERLALGVVDDHGVDVRIGTNDAQTRTLDGAENLAANATLTALKACLLRLVLVHAETP